MGHVRVAASTIVEEKRRAHGARSYELTQETLQRTSLRLEAVRRRRRRERKRKKVRGRGTEGQQQQQTSLTFSSLSPSLVLLPTLPLSHSPPLPRSYRPIAPAAVLHNGIHRLQPPRPACALAGARHRRSLGLPRFSLGALARRPSSVHVAAEAAPPQHACWRPSPLRNAPLCRHRTAATAAAAQQ